METRRTALVDLSLDLIQKLIAHGHLAGSIYNISHRRDPASGRSVRKVGCTEERPLLWPTRMAWLLPCLPWLTEPCVSWLTEPCVSCHSLMYLTLQINSLLCLTLQIKLLRVSCCL